MPLLTVILPAYNAEVHLAEAINSVISQTFSDFELIIIDDGSTDRTGEIINEIDDSRIRLIQHKQNAGLIAALNEGIALAKSEFVARMDADDVCEPSRFEEQLEFFDQNPDVGVLGTAIRMIDSESRPGKIFEMPLSRDEVEWALPLLCPLAHPTVMMRTDVVKKAAGYSSGAELAEDYDLWGRISAHVGIANLSSPLLKLRKHPGSVTSSRAQDHLTASALVSKSITDNYLGENTPIEIVRCMCSSGISDSTQTVAAAHLLSRLFARYCRKRDERDVRNVRRDFAIRISRLAKNTPELAGRIKLLCLAQKIDRLLIMGLLKRAIGHFVPIARRRLVG
ncbi:MAG: glycosyltransferase [Verrucomicrobiales bacterium]|nr:glycosyltransferase [Verrucomicrobiales bacterium]